MKKLRTLPWSMLVSGIIWFLFSGCTLEEVHQSAEIKAHFRLQSTVVLDGKVTIDEAFLKLREINISGSSESGHNHQTVAIPVDQPPYQLSKVDSGQISFNLPSRNFHQLDLQLYLLPDSYQLVIHDEIDPPADGGGSDQPDSDEDAGGEEDADPENGEGTGQEGNDDGSDDADENGDNDRGDDSDEDNDNDDDEDENGKDNDKDKKDKGKDGKDKGKDNDDDDNRGDDNGRALQTNIGAVDIDDFFQNARPGLVIAATYQSNAKNFKLIFIGDNIVSISVRAKQNDSENIILNEKNTADIAFNPEEWFQSLSPAAIESAEIQLYQGQQVIFIHSKFNTAIHEALTEKLKDSATLNIAPLLENL